MARKRGAASSKIMEGPATPRKGVPTPSTARPPMYMPLPLANVVMRPPATEMIDPLRKQKAASQRRGGGGTT